MLNMKEVQAIKNMEEITLVSHLLKLRFSEQMSDIWNIGINLALRISDLLSVKFTDIQGGRLVIKTSKTGSLSSILLNKKARRLIEKIRNEHPTHVYLFQSYRNQQSISRDPKPLSRRCVSEAFKVVGDELGLHLGTHSMRKSRGYHLYKATKDIARVMKMLAHTTESATLRYIGLDQEQIDCDFVSLEL